MYWVLALVIVLILIALYYYMNPTDVQNFEPGDEESPPNPSPATPVDYEPAQSWTEDIKMIDLDPSVAENHSRFADDAMRFSSGANFTSVADDNNSFAFVNFQGLRRPAHVNIGKDARQTPDIDETVLSRNKPYRFA